MFIEKSGTAFRSTPVPPYVGSHFLQTGDDQSTAQEASNGPRKHIVFKIKPVNQEFTFIAQIEVKKSSGLVGDPIYIPTVMIGYSEMENFSLHDGNSITITHPEGVTVTYTVDNNDIVWNPFTTLNRYEFNFDSMIEASGHLITGQVIDSEGAPLGGVAMQGLPNTPLTDTNAWKKQGLITGKEKGQIQSCAARADLP